MITVRVKRRLESTVLDVPELRELVGKDVEIVVSAVEPRPSYPLHGLLVTMDDPFEPLPEDDWEALQ